MFIGKWNKSKRNSVLDWEPLACKPDFKTFGPNFQPGKEYWVWQVWEGTAQDP